jgi:hypothetical protein
VFTVVEKYGIEEADRRTLFLLQGTDKVGGVGSHDLNDSPTMAN